MSFGSAFIKLCSGIVMISCSLSSAAQTDLSDNLNIKSELAKKTYTVFINKYDECNDKKTRANNPYPINDWLISLHKEKQASVVVYLYSLAEYRCLELERNNLINIFEKENELKALKTLESEGWLKKPIYGEFSYTDKDLIQLTKDDEYGFELLTEMKIKPFDGIGMGELLFKLREENEQK